MNGNMLIATVGIPGSGKSHWAKQAEELPKTVRINKDDIRLRLHDGVWSKANEREVLAEQERLIDDAVKNNVHIIIIDDTNFNQIERLKKIAEKIGYEFIIYDFSDVPGELCFERNSAREGIARVPDDAMRRFLRIRRSYFQERWKHAEYSMDMSYLTSSPEIGII